MSDDNSEYDSSSPATPNAELEAEIQAILAEKEAQMRRDLENNPITIMGNTVPLDYVNRDVLPQDDLGFPRMVRYDLADLRAGLWEILYRLRLFSEPGEVPGIDVHAISEAEVRAGINTYGRRLLRITGPRLGRQLQREDGALLGGIKRYKDALEQKQKSGNASDDGIGGSIICRFAGFMEPLLAEYRTKALTGKAGGGHIAVNVLDHIEPVVASYITIKIALDAVLCRDLDKRKYRHVTREIAEAVCAEIQANKEIYKGRTRYKHLAEKLRKSWKKRRQTRGRADVRRALEEMKKLRSAASRKDEFGGYDPLALAADYAASIGLEMKDVIGAVLWRLLEQAAEAECKHFSRTEPAFFADRHTTGKDARPKYIAAADWLIDEFIQKHDRNSDQYPLVRPMLTFPAPWITSAGYKGLKPGGYRGAVRDTRAQNGLVKSDEKRQLDDLTLMIRRADSPVIRVIHGLQNTAFRINRRVFDVVDANKDTAKVAPVPPPDRPAFELETDTEKKKKIWNKWYREERPKYLASQYVHIEASDNLNEAAIFFPHTFDYRGRVYPKGAFLHPQGTDIARGLLEFTEGKALASQDAVDALAIHGANCYGRGVDKKPLAERISWIKEHEAEIKAIAEAEDPTDSDLWKRAKDKWQFLAFCYDWCGYLKDGLDHVSHLPVFVDGTCNGYQHMAALTRSRDIGVLVGMAERTANDGSLDIYETVMEFVKQQIEKDVAGGKPDALKLDKILKARGPDESGLTLNRDLAKSPVMTFGYGGTTKNFRDAISKHIRELRDKDPSEIPDSQWELLETAEKKTVKKTGEEYDSTWRFSISNYLAGLFMKAIGKELAGADSARKQLKTIGGRLVGIDGKGKEDAAFKPIFYTTPAGFPVVMTEYKYPEDDLKDIKIYGQRLWFSRIPQNGEERRAARLIDAKKVRKGFPPNIIHSLDSTHLVFTIDRCLSEGMRSFVTTHDCFGCLAADMPRMNIILRQAFVNMYRDLDLCSLARQLAEENGDNPEEYSDIEITGDLDIEYVLQSPTFFS